MKIEMDNNFYWLGVLVYNPSLYTLICLCGAIHTSELDRSEVDLSPKRSECDRSNANWDRSKIDLNECGHFLKANWDA